MMTIDDAGETPLGTKTEGAARPVAPTDGWSERACDLVAIMTMAAAFATAMWVTRHSWFYIDDWAYIGRGLSPTELLRPYNGHLSIGVIVTYRVVVGQYGFDGYTLLRAIGLAWLVAVPATVYLTTKARWGAPMAVAAAALLAWTHDPGLEPGSMNHWMALVAGTVGTWALVRQGRRADLVVVGCLAAAFLSAGGAVVFAAAFACHALVTGATRARWAAIGLPSAAWLVWYAAEGRSQPRIPTSVQLSVAEMAALPARGVAATFEGLAFGSPVLGALLGAGFVALAVRQVRAGRAGLASLLAFGLANVAWWLSLGYSRGEIAEPGVARYRVVSAVLLILAVVPPVGSMTILSPRRGRRGAAAAAIVAVVAVVVGIPTVRDAGDDLASRSDATRRYVDIRASSIGNSGTLDDAGAFWLTAGADQSDLEAAFDRYGYDRPATAEELDRRLVDAEGVAVQEGPAPDRACSTLTGPIAQAVDGTTVWSGDEPVTVEARRFGDDWHPVTELAPGRSVRMWFSDDGSAQAWQVRAEGACL